MRQTRFGFPPTKVRSEATAMIVEPTLGYIASQPPTDLPLGASPRSENFLGRDGGLEPRATLSQHTANPNPLGGQVLGGVEIQSSLGSRYNLISSISRWAWYSAGSYSPLSFVSSGGVSIPPSATTLDRIQFSQIYEPTNDEMLGVGSYTSSYQTMFCWKAGTTIFSALTQSPRARWNAALDNFVVAANVRDSSGSKYIQRVQWSDRGNPFNWTTGLAGFQDLLDAKGGITFLAAQEARIVVFFEQEIWTMVRGTFPNTFQLAPLDRAVGTPYGKTVVETPKGLIFLAKNFEVYLLPKDGGAALHIGENIHKHLRDTIDFPDNAWAVFDNLTETYQLYYPARAGTSLPQRSLWLDIETGAWWPQRFDQVDGSRNLTAGWTGLLTTGTAGLTWSTLSALGYTWSSLPYTWAQMGPTSVAGQQVTYAGSSSGTVFYFNSAGTSDDGTTVVNRWRSGAFGGENPELQKTVNGFRMDYSAAAMSSVSVAFSRDQGATFDAPFAVSLAQADDQMTAVGYPYSVGRYPQFEVTTTDRNLRLTRFWVAMRMGGR